MTPPQASEPRPDTEAADSKLTEIITWLESRAKRCREEPAWHEGAVIYAERAEYLTKLASEIAALRSRVAQMERVVKAAQGWWQSEWDGARAASINKARSLHDNSALEADEYELIEAIAALTTLTGSDNNG